MLAMAGPANRQGRLAADNIMGRPRAYKGSYGTSVLRCFGLTAACTGAAEKTLKAAGVPYHAVHVHPRSHAGYYPGSAMMSLKVRRDRNVTAT
jgi:NADPH-dependent 2,4-dienoyl-CoA reductase/sulfur reductase-like enzyme